MLLHNCFISHHSVALEIFQGGGLPLSSPACANDIINNHHAEQVEQGITSHQTHYRSYRGQVLWVKRPKQQCQSTEGREVLRIRLQFHQVHTTMLTKIQQLCSMKQKHTKYTQINRNKSMHNKEGSTLTKPNPENCKNCSSKCAYDCAQLQYTIQHRTVLIISPLTSRQTS